MPENQIDELKIGLAFSGGGYRAACFCLGTISYMDKLKIKEKSLLEHVVALSTVSGGTITGTAYAVGIKHGKNFQSIYKSLFEFVKDVDLIGLSLDRLSSDEGWEEGRVKSMINAFADVYNEKLFGGTTFGTLLTDERPIHLKHMSFNATEFSNALQFRFQWSEKIINPKEKEEPRGIIGNHKFRVPEEAAREIKMGSIMASSSCFPGGFEPINFPSDFVHSESPELKKLGHREEYPVGLMDGGVVDNQGIEPILLAEQRMKRNRTDLNKKGNELDLIIASDVASPYMEDYKASQQHPARGWRNLNLMTILLLNTLLLIISIIGLYWFIRQENTLMTILSTAILTISLVVFLLGNIIKGLPKKLDVPAFFLKPFGKLLRLKLQVYETMIVNRKNSVMKMVGEVFLKHERRLNYDKIYDDPSWKNREIMNAIYELRADKDWVEKKFKKEGLPGFLMPSPMLQEVARKAASMGTTLWFTPEEIEKQNMLNTLIACGQFTICWNLLEYIIKAKKDPQNLSPHHTSIFDLEKELEADWASFNADPYWLVNQVNQA